jgi:hypothetical protein
LILAIDFSILIGKIMFVIEKNIPVPENVRTGRRSTYPLSDMQVGDSFLVPFDLDDHKKVTQRVHSAASQFRRRVTDSQRQFVVREETTGVRVWRIA